LAIQLVLGSGKVQSLKNKFQLMGRKHTGRPIKA
jgi:hypothetical protein